MILPWLDVNDSEVFNAARTLAYLRQIDGARESGIWELSAAEPCDRLLAPPNTLDPYPPFVDPATDYDATGFPAWYNPDFPESAEFFGMLITDITGLSSTLSRSLTDKSAGGGKLGPQRREPRVITIKGVLVGSPCGTAYGRRWLNDYLRVGGGCNYYRFGFYKCCPDSDTVDAGYWGLEQAALTSFMVAKPLDPRSGSVSNLSIAGCDMVEVEFQITAANPYLYKRYVKVAQGSSEVFSPIIDVPAIGTTSFFVVWGVCTSGKLTIDGGATTIIEFAGLPPGSVFEYDSSTQTTFYSTPGPDSEFGDGAKFITSLSNGEPLPWLTVDAGCDVDTIGLKAESDTVTANSTTIWTRHREG